MLRCDRIDIAESVSQMLGWHDFFIRVLAVRHRFGFLLRSVYLGSLPFWFLLNVIFYIPVDLRDLKQKVSSWWDRSRKWSLRGPNWITFFCCQGLMNLRVSRILNFNRPMYDVLIILNKK